MTCAVLSRKFPVAVCRTESAWCFAALQSMSLGTIWDDRFPQVRALHLCREALQPQREADFEVGHL